jgi:hypothetical protein
VLLAQFYVILLTLVGDLPYFFVEFINAEGQDLGIPLPSSVDNVNNWIV